jgi:hypothetical protein
MVSTNTRPDISELQLSLALLLYDGFTGAHELIGNISVSLVNEMLASPLHEAPGSPPTAGQKTPQETFRKTPEATFLFFGLSPGAYVLQVRSNGASPDQTPPFYLPADIPVNVTDLPVMVTAQKPIWPAFPDINLADSTKPLPDPTQPEAYRAQRRAATLQPSTAYPFPAGSTLVRGTVLANGAPLAEARVQRVSDDLSYPTGDDGGFVLFFTQISGVGETITLQATHALHPLVQQKTDVHRGMTVATNIVMAP